MYNKIWHCKEAALLAYNLHSCWLSLVCVFRPKQFDKIDSRTPDNMLAPKFGHVEDETDNDDSSVEESEILVHFLDGFFAVFLSYSLWTNWISRQERSYHLNG
jgi:hypothetical protein